MRGQEIDIKPVWLIVRGSCAEDHSFYAAFTDRYKAEEQIKILNNSGDGADEYYLESLPLDFPIGSMLPRYKSVALTYRDESGLGRFGVSENESFLILDGTEVGESFTEGAGYVRVRVTRIDGDIDEMKKRAMDLVKAKVHERTLAKRDASQ